LSLVKDEHGEEAVQLLEETIKQGASTASDLLFLTCRRLRQEDQDPEEGVAGQGDSKTNPKAGGVSVFDLYKKFQLLTNQGILSRCPPLWPVEKDPPSGASTTGVPTATKASPTFVEPDLKALNSALASGTSLFEGARPDGEFYWRMDSSVMAALLRDSIIVQAATRRLDESAGQVVASLLSLVHTNSKAWAPVSSHLGHQAIQERVAADHGKDTMAHRYLDQYLKLLADDRTRFVDRVGDSGGGQYTLNMEHIVRSLAESTLDCIVLERFGSKALRIFRYVREKKYVEEGSLQAVVMIPTKETKMLTYQLLENHFLHLQELRKTLASNVPSKAFCLFYVNMDQVVRSCVSLCYKSIYNLGRRAEIEALDQARLLTKEEDVENAMARAKAEGGSEEVLQEILELVTPPEKTALDRVHKQLEKLSQARIQAGETLFILQTHLYYRQA